MSDAKPCPDYREHSDPTPWRVTAGSTYGNAAHYSAWTCDRHLTGTVLYARQFTGMLPIIVPQDRGPLKAEMNRLDVLAGER